MRVTGRVGILLLAAALVTTACWASRPTSPLPEVVWAKDGYASAPEVEARADAPDGPTLLLTRRGRTGEAYLESVESAPLRWMRQATGVGEGPKVYRPTGATAERAGILLREFESLERSVDRIQRALEREEQRALEAERRNTPSSACTSIPRPSTSFLAQRGDPVPIAVIRAQNAEAALRRDEAKAEIDEFLRRFRRAERVAPTSR